MPEKEIYGAQPPLELIRQWIDYEFWYDRQNQMLKYVKKILLIGAMGPPGGGRNTVTNRLISCFSIINLTFPEEPQITKIYKSMLDQHLLPFDNHIRNLSKTLIYYILELQYLHTNTVQQWSSSTLVKMWSINQIIFICHSHYH